jgi:alpha-N-arabinofuranosidase
MLCTPTYHVFEMFKVHQDATLLPLELEGETIERSGVSIPQLSASASRDGEGRRHLSLCNLDAERAAEVQVALRDAAPLGGAHGRILTAPSMDSRNTFDTPDAVAPTTFAAAPVKRDTLTLTLPPMSVVVLELEATTTLRASAREKATRPPGVDR